VAPGANTDPEGEVWLRLVYIEAALSADATDYLPAPEEGLALDEIVVASGRRWVEPAAESRRLARHSRDVLHHGKVSRARIEATDPQLLNHALERVLYALTAPQAAGTQEVVEHQHAQLDGLATGWYAERVERLSNLSNFLAEVHHEARQERPSTSMYLISCAKPYDRKVLVTFEALEWVYRWRTHAHADDYSWLILPSRWLHRTELDASGQRWLLAPDAVDDECLKLAFRNSDGDAASFLAQLELTSRGESLIDRWERWTRSCRCVGESVSAVCPLLDIEQRVEEYLGLARDRRLHRYRAFTSEFSEEAGAHDLLVIANVLREWLAPGAS
jgi:hypothetical protein